MNDQVVTLRPMLRMAAVAKMIGVNKSTIYRWMEREQFPQPINLGDSVIAFFEDEVVAWQKDREAQRASPIVILPIRPRFGARQRRPQSPE